MASTMPAPDRQLNTLLSELLALLAVSSEEQVLIGTDVAGSADAEALEVLRDTGLLSDAEPAKGTICDGCERACPMEVEFVARADGQPVAFIVCDKREDIGRVPVEPILLRQWQLSFAQIATVLSRLLNTDRKPQRYHETWMWSLGAVRQGEYRVEGFLCAKSDDELPAAGFGVSLTDGPVSAGQPEIALPRLLAFRDGRLVADQTALLAMLRQRSDDERVACEIKLEFGAIVLINHVTGQRRIVARPHFNSTNDNAFQALFEHAGHKLALSELRDAARDQTIDDLHKLVENLNFTGTLKQLFFRISRKAIKFERAITVGQLAVVGMDPRDID